MSRKGAPLRAPGADAHFFDKYNGNQINDLRIAARRFRTRDRPSAEADGGVHK